MRRAEALAILKWHAGELTRRFGVCDLTLFGSVARAEAIQESDVDVLVGFDGPANFDRFMDKFFLEEILSARVDLVTRAGLHPRMRPVIER